MKAFLWIVAGFALIWMLAQMSPPPPKPAPVAVTPERVKAGCEQLRRQTYDRPTSGLSLKDQDQIRVCEMLGYYQR